MFVNNVIRKNVKREAEDEDKQFVFINNVLDMMCYKKQTVENIKY